MISKAAALPDDVEAVEEFLLFSRSCQLQLLSWGSGDLKGASRLVHRTLQTSRLYSSEQGV